jgi:hypothetical protein
MIEQAAGAVMVLSARVVPSTMTASPRSACPAAAPGIERERATDRQHLLLAAGELVAEIAAALFSRGNIRRPVTVHGPGCATAVMFSDRQRAKILRPAAPSRSLPAPAGPASSG